MVAEWNEDHANQERIAKLLRFNSTYNNLSLIYRDNKSSTTTINFYATNLSTNSTCTQSSTSQIVTLNCTVLATGLYQFVNATWKGLCTGDRLNPRDNTRCAMKLISSGGITHWLADWRTAKKLRDAGFLTEQFSYGIIK